MYNIRHDNDFRLPQHVQRVELTGLRWNVGPPLAWPHNMMPLVDRAGFNSGPLVRTQFTEIIC